MDTWSTDVGAHNPNVGEGEALIMELTLVNRYGEPWVVEQRESEALTRLGGFLMMYGDQSCLTLNARLSEADKARGREELLDQLITTPIGTSSTVLWHSDTEVEH